MSQHDRPAPFQILEQWMERMKTLPALARYLERRPELVGIGTDPGLLGAMRANSLARHLMIPDAPITPESLA